MYIGPGNNGNLIRSLMKKRFWFVECSSPKEANFVWTQIKIEAVFQRQPTTTLRVTSRAPPSNGPEVRLKPTGPSLLKKKGAKQFEPNDPLLKILNFKHY